MKKLKNLHIVIAEDDFDDSEVIFESFQKHPLFHKIEIVKNGKELLDYLNDDEKENPDLVLTDLNMPIVNGLEVLKEICRTQNGNKSPSLPTPHPAASFTRPNVWILAQRHF